jgi:SRSO17 transposase
MCDQTLVVDLAVWTEMVRGWSASFAAFASRFAPRFPRVESRRQAVSYLRGLLGETERKNGWTLGEAAGDAGPEKMQRLLNFYAWDADGLRDDVRDVVVEAIGDRKQGVLILDETGFLKKGTQSAGVARQSAHRWLPMTGRPALHDGSAAD